MTPEAERLLEYLAGAGYGAPDDPDPIVVRWLEALGGETVLARQLLERLRDTSIPARADDSLGQLARWEDAVGLPVRPEGRTEAQRRQQLLARLQGRDVVHGRDWVAALTEALGTDQWTHAEHTPGPNQLTLTLPYVPGGFTAGAVEQLARELTPANQEIVMAYDEGFIVGVSRVGDAI